MILVCSLNETKQLTKLFIPPTSQRAIWLDLTGDGRKSILAARAKLPSILNGNVRSQSERTAGAIGKGQLVWLERPIPHTFDVETGTPLDVDGTVFDPFNARNTPWKLRRVLPM